VATEQQDSCKVVEDALRGRFDPWRTPVPTTIAIESHPVEFRGTDTGFDHLYLVRTTTDGEGRIVSETVIRGGLGSDGTVSIQAGIPLALSDDARRGDTPADRHQKILDLGGRSASDVWNLMLQHARSIDRADLRYSFDLSGDGGNDVNSNTVVASVLHTVGISLARNLPPTVRPGEVPLYDQVRAVTVDDVLKGTARDDQILGGVGSDRLYGGAGHDRLSGQSGSDRLAGYSGSDRLSGSGGDDWLNGGSGSDVLSGGPGLDAFVFSNQFGGPSDVDRITDFSVRDDTLWLSRRVFDEAGPLGRLKSWAFWTGVEAHDSNDRIVYDRGTGALYYDPDGTGAAQQVQFAQLGAGLRITSADFLII
jgi:Ca2+-binding RTX toxin-like protein